MAVPANSIAPPRTLQSKIAGCLDFLAVATALILLIVIVALSQIPLIQGGEPPKSSEARAALGAMKDRARVICQRRPELTEIRKEDLGLGATENDGKHFRQSDYTCGGTPENWWAQCEGVFEVEPRHLRIEGSLQTGQFRFNR